jgi:hypothetical protein
MEATVVVEVVVRGTIVSRELGRRRLEGANRRSDGVVVRQVVGDVAAKLTHIGQAANEAAELALCRQVELLDVGRAELRIQCGRDAATGVGRAVDGRRRKSTSKLGVLWTGGSDSLCRRISTEGCGKGLVDQCSAGGHVLRSESHAEAATHHCLRKRCVGKADARSQVAVIGTDVTRPRSTILTRNHDDSLRRIKVRENVVLLDVRRKQIVANTEIHRQVRREMDIILNEAVRLPSEVARCVQDRVAAAGDVITREQSGEVLEGPVALAVSVCVVLP